MQHRRLRVQGAGGDRVGLIAGRSGEFLSYLRHVRNYSPETLRAYEADLRQFVAFLAEGGHGADPREVDTPLVRR